MEVVAIVKCDNYDSFTVYEALSKLFQLLGGVQQFFSADKNIVIKPNLCLPEGPSEAFTTHPEIVKQLGIICKQENCNLTITDNPVGEATSAKVNQVWEKTGMQDALKDIDYVQHYTNSEFSRYDTKIYNKPCTFLVPDIFLNADLVVNVPKFKTHCLMTFTGAIKNMYGVLPGNYKKELHKKFSETKEFAAMLIKLYDLINPRLNIIDAVYGIQGDGPGKKGEKRKIGLLIGGVNGFAVDYVASRIMGVDPHTIPTISELITKHRELCNFDEIVTVGEEIDTCIIRGFKLPATYRYKKSIVEELFKLSKEILTIDENKCKECGQCSLVCPSRAIIQRENSRYIDNSHCIGCMSCIEICPYSAVSVNKPIIYEQLKSLKTNR